MQEQIEFLKKKKEQLWLNTTYQPVKTGFDSIELNYSDILDAEERLKRFRPLIMKAFPETIKNEGMIESELIPIPETIELFEDYYKHDFPGCYLLKADSHLPVSGSVKARGGIYEILHHAEQLAISQGLLSLEDDYSILLSDRFKDFFSQYTIAVGSTGNLGLSIGIISKVLHFNVTIHMSSDAKEWKKKLLREKGAEVIEYESDYSVAVINGRKQAESEAKTYFIDDENSKILFLGYATAALRLKVQLEDLNISVDSTHPLFVYLPCGVGGAPGGITFGLKQVFGDAVHIFFAEPVDSPCMFLGVLTGRHELISVEDIGLTNKTEADGLAVARASGFVGKAVGQLISGFYTVLDDHLYPHLKMLYRGNQVNIEPSAAISLAGYDRLYENDYLTMHNIKAKDVTHIAWATGGNMVPKDEFDKWLKK